MVPMGLPGSGRRSGATSPWAVALADIEDARVNFGFLAGVELEVKARLWKPDAKETSVELHLEYLACKAPYRRRQFNIWSGVGAFGEVKLWREGVSGGEVAQGGTMSYIYWTVN